MLFRSNFLQILPIPPPIPVAATAELHSADFQHFYFARSGTMKKQLRVVLLIESSRAFGRGLLAGIAALVLIGSAAAILLGLFSKISLCKKCCLT